MSSNENHEPVPPLVLTDEDTARLKLMTTLMGTAILVTAKGYGIGIAEAATKVGEDWYGRVHAERGEAYADGVREFASRIGESMNRLAGDRLRALGFPA